MLDGFQPSNTKLDIERDESPDQCQPYFERVHTVSFFMRATEMNRRMCM
jgi:hypothetical protein